MMADDGSDLLIGHLEDLSLEGEKKEKEESEEVEVKKKGSAGKKEISEEEKAEKSRLREEQRKEFWKEKRKRQKERRKERGEPRKKRFEDPIQPLQKPVVVIDMSWGELQTTKETRSLANQVSFFFSSFLSPLGTPIIFFVHSHFSMVLMFFTGGTYLRSPATSSQTPGTPSDKCPGAHSRSSCQSRWIRKVGTGDALGAP